MSVVLNLERINELKEQAEDQADAKCAAMELAIRAAEMVVSETKEALEPLMEFGIISEVWSSAVTDNEVLVRIILENDKTVKVPFSVRLSLGFKVRPGCFPYDPWIIDFRSQMPDHNAGKAGARMWCNYLHVEDTEESKEQVMATVSGLLSSRMDAPLAVFFAELKERENANKKR